MQFSIPLSALEESSVADILDKLDEREFKMLLRRAGRATAFVDQNRQASELSRDLNFTLDTQLIIVLP